MTSHLEILPTVARRIQYIFERELRFESGLIDWKPRYQFSTLRQDAFSTKWVKINHQCLKIYFQVSIDETYEPIVVLRKLQRHVQHMMNEYRLPVEVELYMQVTQFSSKNENCHKKVPSLSEEATGFD